MKTFLFAAAVLLCVATSAFASKPCGPGTWYFNKQRSTEAWSQEADFIFTGVVVARAEKIEPYPNCALTDRSQCTMQDNSAISVKIDKWEKGTPPDLKLIKLSPSYCSQDPLKAIGQSFRFYIRNEEQGIFRYIFYIAVSN